LSAVRPDAWVDNDVPGRYRTASIVENLFVLVVPTLVVAAFGLFVRLPNWPLGALVVLILSAIAVAAFTYIERYRWPNRVGLEPNGMLFVYPDGRRRPIWWREVAEMRLVPESFRHESYLSIRYRDGRRETAGFVWGSCALAVHDYGKQHGVSTTA